MTTWSRRKEEVMKRRVALLVLALIAAVVSAVLLMGAGNTAETGLDEDRVFQFGCDFVKTANLDPFKDELGITNVHEHEFWGYKYPTNDVTVRQLLSATEAQNSCGPSFVKLMMWNPVNRDAVGGRNVPQRLSYYVTVYPDRSPIPQGSKIVARSVDFRCGEQAPVSTPPYGCQAPSFRVRYFLPNCWDGQGKNPQDFYYAAESGCGPNGTRIAAVRVALHYGNSGGMLASPLEFSTGDDTWGDFTTAHFDAFEVNKQPDYNNTVSTCSYKVPRPAYCTPPGGSNAL